jgi:PadR family transcriptional regulator AphA
MCIYKLLYISYFIYAISGGFLTRSREPSESLLLGRTICYNSSMTISLLGYAILSLLARVPLSGYDLAREMKKPHSFFFGQAQLSQIYPELARLEAAELVTSQIIEQRGRPDRKVYSISPLGLQRLQSWVVSPTPLLEVRSEFLIKAHSLWLADPEQALLQFQEQERSHQANLGAYEAELTRIEESWGIEIRLMNMPALGDYLTVKRGVGYEREYIAWLQWVIVILEERVKQKFEELAPGQIREPFSRRNQH